MAIDLDQLARNATQRVHYFVNRSAAQHIRQMRERNALHPSNRPLFDQIEALKRQHPQHQEPTP